eukprot:TRINITY_DN101885_c0_g1_i1.p1 TRINITY_DN101885_c0_g1~~TRINITY_DN101885_c0_g1_i1.p1  ORF type:complete len:432 (-),score=77.46 TRINITY_DN101885_c0_g1_i1:8-1303(-)
MGAKASAIAESAAELQLDNEIEREGRETAPARHTAGGSAPSKPAVAKQKVRFANKPAAHENGSDKTPLPQFPIAGQDTVQQTESLTQALYLAANHEGRMVRGHLVAPRLPPTGSTHLPRLDPFHNFRHEDPTQEWHRACYDPDDPFSEWRPKPQVGRLQVHIMAAHDLKNVDSGVMGDVSDPYVVVCVGKDEHKTPVINNNQNPVWREGNMFIFSVWELDATLELMVKNSNFVSSDEVLGRLNVPLRHVTKGSWQQFKERLLDGHTGSQLEFELFWESPAPAGASQAIAGAGGVMTPADFWHQERVHEQMLRAPPAPAQLGVKTDVHRIRLQPAGHAATTGRISRPVSGEPAWPAAVAIHQPARVAAAAAPPVAITSLGLAVHGAYPGSGPLRHPPAQLVHAATVGTPVHRSPMPSALRTASSHSSILYAH